MSRPKKAPASSAGGEVEEAGARDVAPVAAHPSRPDVVELRSTDLPYAELDHDAAVFRGFAIDYVVRIDGLVFVSGWVAGYEGAEVVRPGERGGGRASAGAVTFFRRPDLEMAYPASADKVRGMLAAIDLGKRTSFWLCGTRFELGAPQADDPGLERLAAEHKARLGFVLAAAGDRSGLCARVAAQVIPISSPRARGFVEQAKGVSAHGGLVVGWVVTCPGVRLALADSAGGFVWADKAIRWHRPDIVDAFGHEFGNDTFNAGFMHAWRRPILLGQEIRLIAVDGDEACTVAAARWDAAPQEPVSFARWAFAFPTPADRFFERLEQHDGPIIEALVQAKLAGRPRDRVELSEFGRLPADPRCSVVVPLFGRFDFMLNQLLAFSEDEEIRDGAELIYVVDDPRILSDVRRAAPRLFEANRVPFRLVSAGDNRGFSGANNVGIAVARAPNLLLLNSDVIPIEPGWLGKMLAVLESRADVGAVGARLFYPNGSVQHDGIAFAWEPDLNAHVNKHPGMGLEAPPPSPKATPRTALTGACLLMRRADYLRIGGLDEGFLVGDFEDSDLCLKVREAGFSLVCVEDVNLVHLERQSFSAIGQDSFRNFVVRYNAWRHERRWKTAITAILAAEGAS
ncbi:glycosyltransferase family 2 protein [Rhodoplanes sp. TEM]|uniref:Glycosyltransferase family 2 protein n=1 Tax=Rhodoplanes tepidamans TaxID=200616 RepID=A0ABT5JAW9_RHOTP|nr:MULTISPECIES: glycosyltransferase family 2 protein [Rhodoplanes]MDC7786698.1 glycosyltransferase family 2 protein [Rhodoplanes tepidamans]MDC7983704.1 glycosyltransferase family 2 protein [Rhodoplanes sp. TEM]MDQ0358134.1 GT2 family glycosyltransferase [Rhodoplanes tepidamans]